MDATSLKLHPPGDEHVPGDARRSALRQWFLLEPGQRLAEAERAVVAAHLANLFGYNLLQVGCLPATDLLATSRVLHRTVVDLGGDDDAPAFDSLVRGSASALPVESDRMDVVVLPHVLEFEASPAEALREASRVLIADGHIVMSVFSPLSLLGVWRAALKHRDVPPWNGRFFTVSRMRDWLELLGFDLLDSTALYFRPPIARPRLLDRLAPAGRIAARFCPLLGGSQVLLARKRVAKLTPIRPRFSYPRRLVGVSLAGPPARVSNGK